jgi:hypothetical protein
MIRFDSALMLLFLWAFGGCAHFSGLTRRVPGRKQLPPPERPVYWSGDGVPGAPQIVVGLQEQRAFFMKGRRVVAETGVSSGRNGFETPPGKYRVIQKDEKHVSNLYGDFVGADGQVIRRNVDISKDRPPDGAVFSGAPMPYFLRFSRGFGFHAGHLPGRPASHGCIRLPEEMAKHFFESADIGTPVRVEKSWLPDSPAHSSSPKANLKAPHKLVPKSKGVAAGGRGRAKPESRGRVVEPASGWLKLKAWFGLARG